MKRPAISPQSGSLRPFALLLAAVLPLAAYFFWNVRQQKPVANPMVVADAASTKPVTSPMHIDPPQADQQKQKIDAKHNMIRLHEGSLRDLEKSLATRTDSAGRNYFLRAIAEKKRLIAQMKAEVAE
jgi:hypothetical protein